MVPPLDGEWENPFIGGSVIGFDYILLVDNAHDYRIYGREDNVTFIRGNVTISGDLMQGKEIVLQNVIIDGYINTRIGDGNIKIVKVNTKSVYYI